MRKTRELLRLKWESKLSNRDIAQSCGVSPSTVSECFVRAKAAGISWPLPIELDDNSLEAKLYVVQATKKKLVAPDFEQIHRELSRKGVTLQLLWQEYRQNHKEQSYQYSQFTVLYRQWRNQLDVVMRQEHRAGEKLFVDYAGQTIPMTDAKTGEVQELQVFVATLGASSYSYAEAMPSQELAQWTLGHVHAFEYFEGVPDIIVPDNLRSGVSKSCRYEPDVNPTYLEMATHYGTAVVPARVRKPRDKAKVENGVQQVERWVLAPLRNHTFLSIAEVNAAIWERLEWLNHRPLSKRAATRRSLFLDLDRPALKPLPSKRYEISAWKCDVGVNIDYHVEFDEHFYSVPYQLVGQRVDIRATETSIECIHKGQRVAAHQRSYGSQRYITIAEHRPKSHQRYAEWTPSRLVNWAKSIGPVTGEVVEEVMKRKPHPEQGYRSCLGIIRLGKRYGNDRLERASQRALTIGAFSYKSIESILRTGIDTQAITATPAQLQPTDHENIRGPAYYSNMEMHHDD